MGRTTIAISTDLRDRLNVLVANRRKKEHRKVKQEDVMEIMIKKEEDAQ